MITIVAGSRHISDYNILLEAIKEAQVIERIIPTSIVSGTAKGADKLGERYAVEQGLPLMQYPADWKKHGIRAGFIRNTEMAEKSEALIALWDGKSNGTKHMIKEARRLNLRVFVYCVKKTSKFFKKKNKKTKENTNIKKGDNI